MSNYLESCFYSDSDPTINCKPGLLEYIIVYCCVHPGAHLPNLRCGKSRHSTGLYLLTVQELVREHEYAGGFCLM